MHIIKLRLVNFKSHKDSEINFDKITSLIGKNSAGKTNVLRALKLVLFNQAWPAKWIRYGQDSASIEVHLSDGTVITRKRTKSNQSIEVSSKGVVTSFKGQQDAQAFIEKVTGIRKLTLDETTGEEDLNFIPVNEPPYLLSCRADVVQRKIAGILGLNTIDDAKTRLIKKQKKEVEQQEALEGQISALEAEVTPLKSILDSSKHLFTKLHDINYKRDDTRQRLENLNDFIHKLETYNINVVDDAIDTNNKIIENITERFLICANIRKVNQLKDLPTLDDIHVKELATEIKEVANSIEVFTLCREQWIKVTTEIRELMIAEETLTEAITKKQEAIKLAQAELGYCITCKRPFNSA